MSLHRQASLEHFFERPPESGERMSSYCLGMKPQKPLLMGIERSTRNWLVFLFCPKIQKRKGKELQSL